MEPAKSSAEERGEERRGEERRGEERREERGEERKGGRRQSGRERVASKQSFENRAKSPRRLVVATRRLSII